MLCCGSPRYSKPPSPLPAPALQILPAFSLQILPLSWTLQAVVRFRPPRSLLVGEMQSLCCDKGNLTKRQILAPGQERPFSFQQIPACSDHGRGSCSQCEARVWLSPALEGRWQQQSGFCWSPISQLHTLGTPRDTHSPWLMG